MWKTANEDVYGIEGGKIILYWVDESHWSASKEGHNKEKISEKEEVTFLGQYKISTIKI